MKTFFTKVWDWKYRNHALCFIVGVVLTVIYFLSIQVNDTDLMEKVISDHRKETEALKEKFVPVARLQFKYDSLEKANLDLKVKTNIYLKENEKLKREKLANINNYYDKQLADSITKWAEQIRGHKVQ